MKIIMTVSNPFKPDPRVYKEAKSLVKAGHEVYVIAWDREGRYPEEEKIEGFSVIRLGPKAEYGPLMALKLPFFYLKAFRAILKLNPSVIHTHDFDTAFLGFSIKYLKKKRWIYDVHDLYHTFFGIEGSTSFFSRLLSKIVEVIDLLFAKHSDHLIVATQSIGGKHEGLREHYIQRDIAPEKITTIWNVPILEEFFGYKDASKKREKFVIGFIGTVRTISNFIPLFEAVKGLKFPAKILFVGDGKSLNNLKRIVIRDHPELDIEFAGSAAYQEVAKYYKMCNVIYSFYPPRENVRRAIAIKVFEAAVMGVPIIVNADSLMEDFVREYKCGIAIKRLTPCHLKKALEFIESKELKFSPSRIIKKWNWKNEEKKLVRIYEQSLNTH